MPHRIAPPLRGILAAAMLAIVSACSHPTPNVSPPAARTTLQPTATAPLSLQDALHQAIRYLYAQQQRSGTWETAAGPQDDPQFGQRTAMAVYALLSAGEDPAYPKLARAIRFLETAEVRGVYALAWRSMVWTMIPDSSGNSAMRGVMVRDLSFLKRALHQNSMMYGDSVDSASGDYNHDASSFAVMGMRALEESGLNVPARYWSEMRLTWLGKQNSDGGWDDGRVHNQSTPAMTAAALSTLLLAEDDLSQETNGAGHGTIDDPAKDRGIDWLGDHFDMIYSGRVYPSLFQIERIGDASGYARFKNVDWFAEGADYILRHQDAGGSWGGNVTDTSYALLFLVYGSAPVTINKLKYFNEVDGKRVEADWNHWPQDVVHFNRWMQWQLPHYPALNWHIVTLDSPAAELHQAPILYITGDEELRFSESDQRKLKRYIDDGGTVLFNADDRESGFNHSVLHLRSELYPNSQFLGVDGDDLIFAHAKFPCRLYLPCVWGMNDGKRNVMLMVPWMDLSKNWHDSRFRTETESFAVGGDILLSTTAGTGLLGKTEVYPVAGPSGGGSSPRDEHGGIHQDKLADEDFDRYYPPPGTLAMPGQGDVVTIHKLKYFNEVDGKRVEADWNHWPRDVENFNRRLVDDFSLAGKVEGNVVTLDCSVRELLQAPILLISGSKALQLSEADQEKLKCFIDQGGLVLFNADEGSAAFAGSVVELGKKLYPLDHFQVLNTGQADAEPGFAVGNKLPPLQRLDNGVRELMILVSSVDVCKAWQEEASYSPDNKNFQLGVALLMYTSDELILRACGNSYLVDPDPAVAADEILKIARIQYAGRWDPEPQAWNRMAAIMHNKTQIDLKIEAVNLADSRANLGGYSIAVLTGIGRADIDDADWGKLIKFVESGGTLIIDSAGGDPVFAEEMQEWLARSFPRGQQINYPLPLSDVFYSPMGMSAPNIALRPGSRPYLVPGGPQIHGIRVGSRIGVFFSPDDLTEGLVGEPISGVYGYEPKSAAFLTENMILYAAMHVKSPTR